MAALTSVQANALSNSFLGLAQAIGDFRYNNWNLLSKSENQRLGNLQWSVLNYGEDILAFSTTLVINDVEDSLARIKKITSQIKGTIGGLHDIQKGINVAAAIVTLGAAIISRKPASIGDALGGVIDTWSS